MCVVVDCFCCFSSQMIVNVWCFDGYGIVLWMCFFVMCYPCSLLLLYARCHGPKISKRPSFFSARFSINLFQFFEQTVYYGLLNKYKYKQVYSNIDSSCMIPRHLSFLGSFLIATD